MTTVQRLLEQKGPVIWTIGPNATVFDAITKMAENNIGSLLVIEAEKLVGIITERHYARNVFLKGKDSPTTPVRDVMETRIVIARPDQPLEECMALMTEERVRHLPVLAGEKLIGLISIGDLIKSLLDDQKFIIKQLEDYIHG